MIRVTVELIPGGVGKPRHMGTALINNDLTGDEHEGNYFVALSKWGRPDAVWKSGEVHGFDRVHRGPWDLLYLALHRIVGGRNAVWPQPPHSTWLVKRGRRQEIWVCAPGFTIEEVVAMVKNSYRRFRVFHLGVGAGTLTLEREHHQLYLPTARGLDQDGEPCIS